MNELVSTVGFAAQHSILPAEVLTRSGATLRTGGLRWAFHGGHNTFSLNFEPIAPLVSPAFLAGLQQTLLWYIENHSPGYACRLFNIVRAIVKGAWKAGEVVDKIDAAALLNFGAALPQNRYFELGSAGAYVKKCHWLGHHGVTADAVTLFQSLRIPGGEKGKAVRSRDPYHGPYSDIEFQAVIDAINRAYAEGGMQREDYVLAWLHILFGARPAQFSLVKACDFERLTNKDGSSELLFRLPTVKKGDRNLRGNSRHRFILPALATIVEAHIGEVQSQFHGRILPDQVPLFPLREQRVSPHPGLEFHSTAKVLGGRLKKALSTLEVVSERTGELINITPTRFRRTLGTRMAAEGHGALIIAEALTHQDTQNALTYVQSTPELMKQIDRATALTLAPLGQAFLGRVVESEKDAVRGDDPTSRIVDGRFDPDFKPMGTCGTEAYCGFAAPLACYTCASFQPWLEGAHEKVLDFLIDERSRLQHTTDPRIATINDMTIAAVADVVRQCTAMKAELRDE